MNKYQNAPFYIYFSTYCCVFHLKSLLLLTICKIHREEQRNK